MAKTGNEVIWRKLNLQTTVRRTKVRRQCVGLNF